VFLKTFVLLLNQFYLSMSDLNRREFLSLHRRRNKTAAPVPMPVAAEMSAVITERLAARSAMPPNSGLAPYTGAWTKDEAIHLLRRTMFGFTRQDVDDFKAMGMQTAVNTLLYAPYTPPPVPVNDYNNPDFTDPNIPFGQTFINEPYDPDVDEGYRVESVRAWWIRQMMKNEPSIREKMVLFWHNHIPIQFYEIFFGSALYRYVDTLRVNSLGNFKTLVKAITLDPAMLIYLNGYLNSAVAPDENYAREIQELFVIGKDLPQHFTEDDVKEAARLLTGWRTNGQFTAFSPFEHDTGDKHFSAFYNNRVIQGQNSVNGGETELDEFLDMLFDHPEPARFLCRKLYRFFVYHEIDAQTEINVIGPLAQIFRDNNYDILPVLDALLKSEHFFDVLNRGAVIKSPVDLLIGQFRQFGVVLPGNADLFDNFYLSLTYGYAMNQILQMPGDPPNVAGWQAYYQQPILDKIWINTSTLPKRGQFNEFLLFVGIQGINNTAKINLLTWAQTLTNPSDVNDFIDEAAFLLMGYPLTQQVKSYLKTILLTDLPSEYYWTIAWEYWQANPNDPAITGAIQTRLLSFMWVLLQKEEYQLT
jgi:uncharacterized protein (DUF1800 family)